MSYVELAKQIGELVEEKQAAYGDSFGKSGLCAPGRQAGGDIRSSGFRRGDPAMKPPYAIITAECSRHGRFQVERKPNPKAGQLHPNGSGALIQKYPHAAIVCPKCRMWAEIQEVKEVVCESKGIRFRCIFCGREFETVEKCNACEESH